MNEKDYFVGADVAYSMDTSAYVIVFDRTVIGEKWARIQRASIRAWDELYGYEPDNSPSLSQPKDNSPMLGGDRKQNAE